MSEQEKSKSTSSSSHKSGEEEKSQSKPSQVEEIKNPEIDGKEKPTPDHIDIDKILESDSSENDGEYHYKFKNGKRKYLFCSDSSDSVASTKAAKTQKKQTYKQNSFLAKNDEDSDSDSNLELIPTQVAKPEPFRDEGRKMLEPSEAAVKRNNKFLQGIEEDDKIKEIDFDPDEIKRESESEQKKETSKKRQKKQVVSKEVMSIFNNMLNQPNYNADISSAQYSKEEQSSSIKESTPMMEEKLQSKKPSSPRNKVDSKSRKLLVRKFEDDSDYSDDIPSDLLNRPKRSFKTDSKIKSKWLQ